MDITCPRCETEYELDREFMENNEQCVCECGTIIDIVDTSQSPDSTISGMTTLSDLSNTTLSGMKTIGFDDGSDITRIDRYIIKEQLGEGGYGAVYRATDEETRIDIAIKMLPREISGNAGQLQEVRNNFTLVSHLHHPNIANISHLHKIVDCSENAEKLGAVTGSYMLVMEYVKGDTIADWQRQFSQKKVPFDMAINICSQVAEALDFAHAEKIIHRDIKPSNVMLNTQGRVKVLDFGIAAHIRSAMSRVSIDHGRLSGTPTHMAPEQWAGKRQGPATDQYALATMFYELITGEVPFASALGVSPDAMRACVINDQPEIAKELSPPRWRALKHGLKKSPEGRYHNCRELLTALTARSNEVKRDLSAASAQDTKRDENLVSSTESNIPVKKKKFPLIIVLSTLFSLIFIKFDYEVSLSSSSVSQIKMSEVTETQGYIMYDESPNEVLKHGEVTYQKLEIYNPTDYDVRSIKIKIGFATFDDKYNNDGIATVESNMLFLEQSIYLNSFTENNCTIRYRLPDKNKELMDSICSVNISLVGASALANNNIYAWVYDHFTSFQ